MDKYRQLAELMKGFQNDGQVFFTATIVSIDGNTCTIEVDELAISDVRLKPTTDELDDDILLTPAIGSSVLVGSFSGDFSNLFILQSDSLSELNIKIGTMSCLMNKNGIIFNDGKNGGSVNINSLISWMQNVYTDMLAIATGLAAVPYTFVPTTQAPVQATLEDTKLKH